MNDALQQKLIAVIAKKLSLNTDQIQMSSRFQEDLGADSLDLVELIMAFEEEFSITISDSESEKIQTVGDAFKLLESKIAEGE